MTCEVNLYTDFKVKLDKSSLTKETFINLYIGNIKKSINNF